MEAMRRQKHKFIQFTRMKIAFYNIMRQSLMLTSLHASIGL